MAKRICFISKPNDTQIYKELLVEFQYYSGFSVSQKQKSIESLHKRIFDLNMNLSVLEVSTKSNNLTGIELSAFNLKFLDENTGNEYPLENVFQSSKVFEHGGPYIDLLNVHPKDAKRDVRLKSSGDLIYFQYNDIICEKEPKTMFYDWIYISSIYRNKNLAKKILDFDAFTDIEFNQEKSINCQARSAAIFVSLSKSRKLEKALSDKEEFKKIYMKNNNENNQLSIFD